MTYEPSEPITRLSLFITPPTVKPMALVKLLVPLPTLISISPVLLATKTSLLFSSLAPTPSAVALLMSLINEPIVVDALISKDSPLMVKLPSDTVKPITDAKLDAVSLTTSSPEASVINNFLEPALSGSLTMEAL